MRGVLRVGEGRGFDVAKLGVSLRFCNMVGRFFGGIC